MRSVFASILMLVSLAGCLQPLSPMSTQEIRRTIAKATAASSPPLILSVTVDPRRLASGGIMVVTLAITNTGNNSVVIGSGPIGFIHLDLDDSNDQRVAEYRFGVFPISIGSKQTLTTPVELPASTYPANQPQVPLDPGLYRFTLSISGRPETSPPSVIRIVPAESRSALTRPGTSSERRDPSWDG
jgi:hypothetical protein